MTDYADLKVSPVLRDVLEDAAARTYGRQHRAISRAGHEAVIAWLVLRCPDDVRRDVLASHGYDSIADLVTELTSTADTADGRFADDPLFDPLAAVETPHGQSGTETETETETGSAD